jgi:arylsulfatase A-like enzyme
MPIGDDRMNILLLVLEGARADHLGAAGYDRETMPYLDQVAREGVRFTHAFTTAPFSAAAYASMLTGVFPSLHGVGEETPVLGPEPRVLPEILKAAGYRTAAFCPDPSLGPDAGFGRGFDRFYTERSGGRITGRAADYARRASDRVLGRRDAGARRTTQALLDWIGGAAAPFFAVVHYREPVKPIQPPAPYDRACMPAALTAAHARAANQAGGGPAHPVSDEEAAALCGLYDGALRYADLRLKQIADVLSAAGRWERTLLIVTAGCGEDLGESGTIGGAPALRDALLRVPLIMRCPGRIPAGFVVEEFAQHSDLLPTVAAMAGCALEAPVQGRALLSGSGASAGPGAVFVEAFRGAGSAVRRKVIRTRREKLVWRSDEDNALYDLGRDALERSNLLGDDAARGDRLRRGLFDWLANGERWALANGLPVALPQQPTRLQQRGAGE